MKEPRIIFFCGPHCSGKSSLLRTLYEEGIFSSWGNEIGKELFYRQGFSTENQSEEFEFKVSREELERDFKFANNPGLIGIETWHPGNLAYATVRNPSSVSKLVSYMKKSPLLSNAYGIRLSIPSEVIFTRTKTFQNNRAWAAIFYTKINNCLDSCMEQLGLQGRYVCIDADREFDIVMKEVKNVIENICFRQ